MVEEILSWVRKGLNVCAVFYGHPGVFGFPPHEAVRRARSEGLPAEMLPGVSAEDCLYADLGVDPGDGCQSFEAMNFLLFPRRFDPTVSLVLWQVAAIGELRGTEHPTLRGLAVLAEYLRGFYGGEHEVVLYEASPYPIGGPTIQRLPLDALSTGKVGAMTTLYVPPKGRPAPDLEMFDRLEIPRPEAES
jgi:Tetrapyrrole (Corrin/Porphyrin) Methylases